MKSHTAGQNNNLVISLGTFISDRFTVSVSDYNFGLRQSWHKHDDFILAMTLKGYLREQVKCEDRTIKPLAIGIKPAETNHTDHFWSKGVRAVKISLTPGFSAELAENSLIYEKWDWLESSPATRSFLRVADNLLYSKASETDVSDGIFEILAAILPDKNLSSVKGVAPKWLRNARENLETTFAEGVRLTKLADEAGVHPVYFARQFRRFFGCSVGRYIRQLQFQKATHLLTDHKNSLAEIAGQVGCSDQAHLSRIFASEFGVTPGRFRNLVS